MRYLKYGLIAVSTVVVPSVSMAASPWTDDPSEPPRYQVAYLAPDGSIKRKETTEQVRLDIDCQVPYAANWTDEPREKPTAALRVVDMEKHTTKVYRCP